MRFRVLKPGIDTHDEHVAFLSAQSPLCEALGVDPMERVRVSSEERSVLAVVNLVHGDLIPPDGVGLSDLAFARMGLTEDTPVEVNPAEPPGSVDLLRKKMSGKTLTPENFDRIVDDVVTGRYSKIELTAFVSCAAIHQLNDAETAALTRALVESGDVLRFDAPVVADKHSIGGVPGNRTTPIVVAIAAAAGLLVPKTSSRAVTSPAGTADTLETLMDVELPLDRIREVLAQENACMTWGGALHLAPADDRIIRVEHPLSLDAEGLMIASILAKKKAVGSTHVLIDIPVGPGAKVPTAMQAEHLRSRFERIGGQLGLHLNCVTSDGSHPIGRGVGPALEAHDVLNVLRGDPDAPVDLAAKSCHLAGRLLELTGNASAGEGEAEAREILRSGAALRKFERIRNAQGRRDPPPPGNVTHDVLAPAEGTVAAVSNKAVARIARLAGAPRDPGAGVLLLKRVGDPVQEGEPVLRVHAESEALLQFAVEFVGVHPEVVHATSPSQRDVPSKARSERI